MEGEGEGEKRGWRGRGRRRVGVVRWSATWRWPYGMVPMGNPSPNPILTLAGEP